MKDIVGAGCSGLCICHCLLTPLLLASGVFGGSLLFLESEWIHRLLLIPVVILAFIAVLSIVKRQSDWMLLIFALFGVGIMLSAIVYEERFGESFEQMATIIGGLLLVALHLINRHRLLQTPSHHTV
jgi:hypothetical protein